MGIGLFFFVCWIPLRVGIQLQHLIIQPAYSLLYFWFTNNKMDLQLRFIQPTFLSGVLIYDDEQGSFINCVSNYYEWLYLGEDRLKTGKLPIII
jgi:hypothetical protein